MAPGCPSVQTAIRQGAGQGYATAIIDFSTERLQVNYSGILYMKLMLVYIVFLIYY